MTSFAEKDALWTLWEAATMLVPPRVSAPLALGLTGAPTRRREKRQERSTEANRAEEQGTSRENLNRSDLQLWVAPGLQEIGLSATPMLLSEPETLERLEERTRRGVCVPLFGFTVPDEVSEVSQPEGERVSQQDRAWQEAPLRVQAVVLDVAAGGLRLKREENSEAETLPWDSVRADYTEALLLSRGRSRTSGEERRRSALGRWAAFAAAYPRRMPSDAMEDTEARELVASFLSEMAGNRRDRISNRVRRAAFQSRTDASQSYHLVLSLLEAFCLMFDLPGSAASALSCPPDLQMTDLARRELIYLARAGTRDLRALAAWRLQGERHHPAAARTLEQMHDDPDPWVRQSAKGGMT